MATTAAVAAHYRQAAANISSRRLLHDADKEAAVRALPLGRRRRGRAELRAAWTAEEELAAAEATALLDALRGAADALVAALHQLDATRRPELLGKVQDEERRVAAVLQSLDAATAAISSRDFGRAGSETEEAYRVLTAFGGALVVTLNTALSQAAIGRDARDRLERTQTAVREARALLDRAAPTSPSARLAATAALYQLEAQALDLAADVLSAQGSLPRRRPRRPAAADASPTVVEPAMLESFADVGGLDEAKEILRGSVGAILERPDAAARYRVVHNGILFHGPPGTGKTLLSRALAGEYGLRYIRFSPAAIASAYVHESATKLRELFELARASAPCLLFLDEIDAIAAHRRDQPSADHREVVTQLMNCLEDYRDVPGLIVCAATNDPDRLDPGLREGRFDTRILVPLPDTAARAAVLRVHLDARGDAVDWSTVDVDKLARLTSGRNCAALALVVSAAAQKALAGSVPISQELLVAAIRDREGTDRLVLDDRLGWDDVVLAPEAREQLAEILAAFTEPETARSLGVSPPAGILLHGPPGTGKTTVAKVLASECAASFHEFSAADLLSKWYGESEQRVARVFERARASRPTIVFIDEIDSLLRRRSSDSAAPWEERVVSQFLRELDGLRGGEGVLLVGATNRIDMIDDAVVERRLTALEIGLPDEGRRRQLLDVLCRGVRLAQDVDLDALASLTDGMSGADLRRIRDAAGMRALGRIAGGTRRRRAAPRVTMADFHDALARQRGRASLAHV
ncbi:MAG: AAA family ATPase [Frankia sp.]|nr:AAA family ATPase [Frankia sp.]